MKNISIYKRLIYPFLKLRANVLAKLVSPFISDKSKVLDVGTGNMLLAKNLISMKNVSITGIDVINMNLTELEHQIFDGVTIPFTENSFDTVLFIGVLHHTKKQVELIQEAIRVSKEKIIIFEDVYNTKYGKLWLKLIDLLGNVPEDPTMPFALNFKTDSEWGEIFRDMGLKVKTVKPFFNPAGLSRHMVYVLEIPSPSINS